MKTQFKLFIVFMGAFLLWGCMGPSDEELQATETQVAANIFGTQTANAPTATTAPTNTPEPPPTDVPPTEVEGDPDAENLSDNPYFPLFRDYTWWYTHQGENEDVVFSNFSLRDVNSTENGTDYFTFITQFPNLDFELNAFFVDSFGVTQFFNATYYLDGSAEEFAMAPGMPIMVLPLEDGDAWEEVTSYGESEITVGFNAVSYPSLEFPNNTFDDCYQITYLEGGLDGDAYYIEYYCIDLGRVGYEVLDGNEWDLYEILVITTGWADWEETNATEDGGCTVTLSLYGFEEGEEYDLTYYLTPDFTEPLDEWTGFSADQLLDFTFGADQDTGVYVMDFNGNQGNTASFSFEWTGTCPSN